jgi:hypothetical protein
MGRGCPWARVHDFQLEAGHDYQSAMDAEADLRDAAVRPRRDEHHLADREIVGRAHRDAEFEDAGRELLLGRVGALTAKAAHEELRVPAWVLQPEQVLVKPPEPMGPEFAARRAQVPQAWRQREEPQVAVA